MGSQERIISAIICQGLRVWEDHPDLGSSFLKMMGRSIVKFQNGDRSELSVVFRLGEWLYWSAYETKLWEEFMVESIKKRGHVALFLYINWMESVRDALVYSQLALSPLLSKDVAKIVAAKIWMSRYEIGWYRPPEK